MNHLQLTPKQSYYLLGATIALFCLFCALIYYVLYREPVTQPMQLISPVPTSNVAGQPGRVK